METSQGEPTNDCVPAAVVHDVQVVGVWCARRFSDQGLFGSCEAATTESGPRGMARQVFCPTDRDR